MRPPNPRGQPLGANYWRLWTASVISNFGDGLSSVAYPWLASAVTRSPVHIALVGVATRLPWLIFSLPAGVAPIGWIGGAWWSRWTLLPAPG